MLTALLSTVDGGRTIAQSDEARPDTSRIQKALDACVKGQAVELRADGARRAFLSGPLNLRPGVTLHVGDGVILRGSGQAGGDDHRMIITSAAPIRVCDCGGWTDTWFARYGRVFNIAVRPCAEVQVEVFPAAGDRPRVVIDALDFGDRYAPAHAAGHWDRHPLIEATLDALPMPPEVAIEVTITCKAPAGASTGTSAAVTVALCGALDRVRGGTLDRREIARLAHTIETDRLKRQSGIQDQICSAMGGVNDIEMTQYPDAEVRPLRLSDATRWELERRLALVCLGRGHSSSEVHERVVAHLSGVGPDCAELDALRQAACDARDALVDGDFAALGRAMRANTEGQRRLHPDLVCADADRVIGVARAHGAAGWKVNGAGGDGGSLTLVGPVSAAARRAMLREIEAEVAGASLIPTQLDTDGLRVWTSAAEAAPIPGGRLRA